MSSTELGFEVSRNIRATDAPPIPQAFEWARKYTPTPSRPLLDMSQGVPGIPPPPEFYDALVEASQSPESVKYGSIAGDFGLRSALVSEMKVVYGEHTDIDEDDISLTAGCNMAFLAAIMALCDSGDEVILPVPWYFNHQMSLTMLGINPIPLHSFPEDGFIPSVERCSKIITERTKAIVLVTPNNPTGAVYPPSILLSFALLAQKHRLPLVLDETYRDFITTGPPHALFANPPLRSSPNPLSWRTNIVHLFSFSKSYCIPGHRLGAVVAAPALQRHIRTVLDSMQICPPRTVQLALAPLLPSFRPFIHTMASELQARYALFRVLLPGEWRIGAQGGYFAFVRHPFSGVSAKTVCRVLAEEWGVVILPAEFFGYGGSADAEEGRWMRVAVANVSDEAVRMACQRLKEHLGATQWTID